jgi:alcohol dehydrogenase class IV
MELPPGQKSILVVTDKTAGQASGVLDALSLLKGRDLRVFDDVKENPSFECLEAGKRAALEHRADLIIGAGGGSPMDAAKGIAVLATNSGDMRDYMKGRALEHDPLPIACLPTTSGTGSEVTPYAVFTDLESRNKGGFAHPKIYPQLALVDPELTYSMPERLAVNTGIDVLTHALESYLSTEATPLTDTLALHVVRTVLNRLGAAARKEKEAMDDLACASLIAGVVIARAGTILLHIAAYPLTVFHGVPHGLANALLLPAFLEFMKRRSSVQDKVAVLDAAFEEAGGLTEFMTGLGVRMGLSQYGVEESEFGLFAAKTIVKGDVRITPAPVTEEEIRAMYRASF